MVQCDQLDLQWRLIDGQFDEMGTWPALGDGNFGQWGDGDMVRDTDRTLDGMALAAAQPSLQHGL